MGLRKPLSCSGAIGLDIEHPFKYILIESFLVAYLHAEFLFCQNLLHSDNPLCLVFIRMQEAGGKSEAAVN